MTIAKEIYIAAGALCTVFALTTAVVVPIKKERLLRESHELFRTAGFNEAEAGCMTGYVHNNVSWMNGLRFGSVQVLPAADSGEVMRRASDYCGTTDKVAFLYK